LWHFHKIINIENSLLQSLKIIIWYKKLSFGIKSYQLVQVGLFVLVL